MSGYDDLVELGPRAYQLAVRILGTQEGAEDVVQDAYVKSFHRMRLDMPSHQRRAWFLRVTANAAKDRLRMVRRRRRKEVPMQAATVPDTSHTVESLGAMRMALNALDQKYRTPISLCYEQELSQREAAYILEIPEKTLCDHVRTGLAKLRKALERAGYPAAVAAVLGGLKTTAPVVPASLAGRVKALVAKGAVKTTATGAATSTSAAAKGGLAMKLIAGLVLAGAIAAGVAVVSDRGGSAPLPAEVPAVERKDPAPDQVYRFEPIVAARNPTMRGRTLFYHWRKGHAGVLDGPGIGAETCGTSDITTDDAGNCYWTEAGHFNVLRMWRASDARVVPVAGSACGSLDGPLESARFTGRSGGGYNNHHVLASRDGKHIFLRETYSGFAVRHIDLESGVVSTVGHKLILAKDASGDIYILNPNGGAVPPGKGYKTFPNAKLEAGGDWWWNNTFKALDVARGRLYAENRKPVHYWDLKTGKMTWLTHHKGAKGKGRPWNTSGPLATAAFYCPTGLSISPGGRYLYLGGGDAQTIHRLDLEKNEVRNLGSNPDGTSAFKEGKESGGFCDFPGNVEFNADGVGFWGGSSGIFRLTPIK